MSDPLDNAHAAMKFAAPNPGEGAQWYKDALGFKAKVFGDGDYAIVMRGKLCLHLWKSTDRKIAENTSCYVELETVEVLDALHKEWLETQNKGEFGKGRIEPKPKNQAGHGMREFHVWDPSGNLIGFGAELKG